VESIDRLRKLAAMAPTSDGAAQPGAPGRSVDAGPSPASAAYGAPNTAKRMKRSELGPIDMERYLTHYGVNYNVKNEPDKSRTLYRLDHCLFDPNHGPNQASIIVPYQGATLYQCFHSSCAGYRWKDARQKISGTAKIAEFCQGYDPSWQPPRDTGTGLIKDLAKPVEDQKTIIPAADGNTPVPPPREIDPREFYEKRGKRPVFVPWLLVQYLAAWLHPICHTSGTFWKYKSGVWSEISRHVIAQIAVQALKDQVQSAWIENSMKIMAGLVNREEEEWPDNPMMLNVRNGMIDMSALMGLPDDDPETDGMIDLHKLDLLPHDAKYGSRVQLPVTFDPDLYSSRWRHFLGDVFPEEKIGAQKEYMLQQFAGYCFLRDARYQKAMFLYGTGANGKSTVLDVIQALVGAENTSSLTLGDLTQRFKS